MDTRSNIAGSSSDGATAPEAACAEPLSPRQVKRGESSEDTPRIGKEVFGAFTDYLNVTFRVPATWTNPAQSFFWRFGEAIGPTFGVMDDLGRGLHGYAHS